jgi:hypothetical protein
MCHYEGAGKSGWLKLNGTLELSVYVDVNILGGSIHTVKESTEALVFASKEIVLEVNADKTKYMVVSGDQNAGRSDSIKIDNNSFERVEEFKYLGTTITNQNYIQEEIQSRLLVRECLLSFDAESPSLLSKNID